MVLQRVKNWFIFLLKRYYEDVIVDFYSNAIKIFVHCTTEFYLIALNKIENNYFKMEFIDIFLTDTPADWLDNLLKEKLGRLEPDEDIR